MVDQKPVHSGDSGADVGGKTTWVCSKCNAMKQGDQMPGLSGCPGSVVDNYKDAGNHAWTQFVSMPGKD